MLACGGVPPAATTASSNPDPDGDGLVGAADHCPETPEDMDGFRDKDGCPEIDNDGDGVPDGDDKCPMKREDKDSFEDEDGCPDEDNDNDRIADAADHCPDEPEDDDGYQDEDGCPEAGSETVNPALALVNKELGIIDLRGNRIEFEPGTAKLTAESVMLLGAVANVIAREQLGVRIEVHVARSTRSTNKAAIARAGRADKKLSVKRGLALQKKLGEVREIRKFLIFGFDAVGSARPLSNFTPYDDVQNRVTIRTVEAPTN
jgi:hypothetical protein